MSTDLAKPLFQITPALSTAQFAELASATRYLPRVQLFGSSNKLVKTKKFESGHYGLVVIKDQPEDLGEEFDCLPLQVRGKAMDISDTSKILNVFDQTSPVFKEIAERSKIKDSQCMYGPEFLLWIPSKNRFATMFFSNPTMRNSAPDVLQLLGRPTTFGVRFIESKQYGGWHGPTVVACSTPFELPTVEQVAEQVQLFENTPKEEVEVASEDDRER